MQDLLSMTLSMDLAGEIQCTCTVESTWSMTPSTRCSDSVFISRNSTPSTDSLVRCAMVFSGMVLSSAGSLQYAQALYSLVCQ